MNMLEAIAPKSDQINAEDLVGRTITVTVREVTIRAGQEQPISVALEETNKVFRPCKTTARLMVGGWGPDPSKYAGKKMTLYRDPSVKWGGVATGGIRISHMSHLDAPLVMALAENKKNRKVHTVQPLQAEKQPEAPQKGRQTAEEWAAEHIAGIHGAQDADAIDALQKASERAMAKLATGNPELHGQIEAAYAKRLGELTPVVEEAE